MTRSGCVTIDDESDPGAWAQALLFPPLVSEAERFGSPAGTLQPSAPPIDRSFHASGDSRVCR